MELRLIREPSQYGATLGVLFVDGVFQCWTLEDPVRAVKVPGETAIPAGRYRVIVTYSNRFSRPLPLLENVKNYTGVRLHPGNRPADTRGCILPGAVRGFAMVSSSRVAFDALFDRIDNATEAVWITVEDTPERRAT